MGIEKFFHHNRLFCLALFSGWLFVADVAWALNCPTGTVKALVFKNGPLNYSGAEPVWRAQEEVCLTDLGEFDSNGVKIGSNNGRLRGKYVEITNTWIVDPGVSSEFVDHGELIHSDP